MTLLLTGHRGFIGSVVHRLVPDARVLETKNPGTAELVERLQGVDCIIHLAGGGGARYCQQHPREAMEGNVVLTHRLVEAARQAGVKRIIFSSSIAVYGTAKSPPNPIAEHHAATPDDLYGSLKWACEEIVKGLPHTILRFSNVYGFGTGTHLDRGGFINNVCRSARTTGRITLTSSTLGMDFVHVTDAARTILLCASSDSGLDSVINIGSGQATSLVHCARIIEEKLDAPVNVVVDERPGYRTRYFDIARARATLGWQPVVGLSDGISELLSRLP
ncbi:MAG: SDR family oxidoreductase [Myxococcaceae bacterium]|nr:SDR family oxidoreductase [Myxococcaceae bacterium]